MQSVLQIILYIDSILLIIVILVQQRGTGLSLTFGGGGEFHRKKRGPEKVLHNATIVFSIAFVLLSLGVAFSSALESFFSSMI